MSASYKKPMGYVKKTACDEMSLAEFSAEWKSLSETDRKTVGLWADEEQATLGVEVPVA